MLKSKFIEVGLGGCNTKYYENLGYTINRYKNKSYKYVVLRGSKITVKVEDLPLKSKVKVICICDSCGKSCEISYSNYNKNKRSGEKTFCKKCKSGRYYSFEQWAKDNSVDIQKYWGIKNKSNPSEVAYKSHKKYWFKCQKIDYHNEYLTSVCSFVTGSRCPYCNNKRIHFKDSLGFLYPEISKFWSNKNTKSIYEISYKSGKFYWWKCENEKHEDYKRRASGSFRRSYRCPRCAMERTESLLQEKVRTYIESLNYTILHENNCTLCPRNPKTNARLYFDNEIKELKLIIEVMGYQHFKKGIGYLKGFAKNKTEALELFKTQKFRDNYKKEYVIAKEYNYLAIPYYLDDKKESWKNSIKNKIKNI